MIRDDWMEYGMVDRSFESGYLRGGVEVEYGDNLLWV